MSLTKASRTLAPTIASLCVCLACADGPARPRGEQPQPARQIVASTPAGRSIVLEVARSDMERARGMMGREQVPPGTGMIFIFDEPGEHPIWMFQCLTALDLVWLDQDRRVVHLVEEAPICPEQPCPNYFPDRPATLVIEVGPGRARDLGLVPGARILLSPGVEGEGP